MFFVWIWEQTAVISLYSIDWLVFVAETKCVYCAVRVKLAIQFNLSVRGVLDVVSTAEDFKQSIMPNSDDPKPPLQDYGDSIDLFQ